MTNLRQGAARVESAAWDESRGPLTSTERSKRHRARKDHAAKAQSDRLDACVYSSAREFIRLAVVDDRPEAAIRYRMIKAIAKEVGPGLAVAPMPRTEELFRWLACQGRSSIRSLILTQDVFPDVPEHEVFTIFVVLTGALFGPQEKETFRRYFVALQDGVVARGNLPVQTSVARQSPGVDADPQAARLARAWGDGEAERRVTKLVAASFEYPGERIPVPERRRLTHPFAPYVDRERWQRMHAFYKSSGAHARRGAEATAPTWMASGQKARQVALKIIARKINEGADWREIRDRNVADLARHAQVTTKVARAAFEETILKFVAISGAEVEYSCEVAHHDWLAMKRGESRPKASMREARIPIPWDHQGARRLWEYVRSREEMLIDEIGEPRQTTPSPAVLLGLDCLRARCTT